MSNVNLAQPLQLIRFRDGQFEVPAETADFLRQFRNPIGVITIVGKYRTGKSLFLNKVLLRKSAFKVSPTINSCTKGLWLCRESIKSQNSSEEIDVLVLDTEGFGAPEETDQYNQKILLFAMLLSSFFIYNSVGSIDENSLNSLNLVSHLAREILKNNSKDERVDEESPAFLWLLRDFALNLVDKNGSSIQAREYLEQSLEVQKGSSDSIESKNKIRRMLKHFFKDRDCFTLVRPVETEEHLQNLLYLPDSSFRAEFIEQANILRSKIMKKVKCKRIKGRPLDGEMLLELANNYIGVVNRGELPNFQLSFKHVMRVQARRSAQEFVNSCKLKINAFSSQLLSIPALEGIEKELIREFQTKFVQMCGDGEEAKSIVEGSKTEITQALTTFSQENDKRCTESYQTAWKSLYDSSMEFDTHSEIQQYFSGLLDELRDEMTSQSNPVEPNYLATMVLKQQVRKMSSFGDQEQTRLKQEVSQRDSRINQLQQQNSVLSSKLGQLEDSSHQLSRNLNRVTSKLSQLQKVKQLEIGYLKQKEAENSQQISQLMTRLQDASRSLEECKSTLSENVKSNEDLARSLRQTSEKQRLSERELDITRNSLQAKGQEVNELRAELSQTMVRLESSLQKQSFIVGKHQSEMEQKNEDYMSLCRKSESQQEQITRMSMQLPQLQKDIENNCSVLERERHIYENMFESLKESFKLESRSRQELIDTNKNLSAALKHLEKRTEQAEEKEKQLKQYKRCVKNSSCLQCHHCTKFFVPSIFLPHLNVCMIGPEALKTTKPDQRSSNKPRLQIWIRQTLVKESEGKPFTEYVLEFKRGDKEWVIHRKYKAFCDLHASLKGFLPGVELSEVSYIVNPQEASKKSLVIEERRKILQKYLNDLQKNHYVSVTPIWFDFIEEPESASQSRRNSPLKQNTRMLNQEQTPEQFFKLWNERQLRGKQSFSLKGGSRWK